MPSVSGWRLQGSPYLGHLSCGDRAACERSAGRRLSRYRFGRVKVRKSLLTCVRTLPGFGVTTSALALTHDGSANSRSLPRVRNGGDLWTRGAIRVDREGGGGHARAGPASPARRPPARSRHDAERPPLPRACGPRARAPPCKADDGAAGKPPKDPPARLRHVQGRLPAAATTSAPARARTTRTGARCCCPHGQPTAE